MKAILLAMVFLLSASFASADWKDCNLPENKAQCEAEFQAMQEARQTMSNQEVCEKLAVCGGGGGAGAGGGA
jgi:hypothetical protein